MNPVVRNAEWLLATAGEYAAQRRVPVQTIIKEMMHAEILFAMLQSGALRGLAFQGGTCLRLCYDGKRYSEDLDFACTQTFDRNAVGRFAEMLCNRIGAAYGLEVSVKEPRATPAGDGIRVARWKAKVKVPNPDPSIPQSQSIHIEIADIPAREVDLVAVRANYPHLTGPFGTLVVPAESPHEILVDKIVALGARSFLKWRDVWDLNDLVGRGLTATPEQIALKLQDYKIDQTRFLATLAQRVEQMEQPEAAREFRAEMSRFVSAEVAVLVGGMAGQRMVANVAQHLAAFRGALGANATPTVPSTRFKPV